jgi:hypothetical protein
MNRTLMLCVGALLFTSGCASKFLVADYFIPDTNKVVRSSIEYGGTVGGDDGAQVVNYYLQVCDLNNGKATNCKSTLILDNVLTVNFYQTGF